MLRFPPQTSGLWETSADVPWETGVTTSTVTNEANMDVRVPEETSVATTIAGVSIAAEASLHTSGSISLDLCSFGELKTVEEMLQVTEFGPFFYLWS